MDREGQSCSFGSTLEHFQDAIARERRLAFRSKTQTSHALALSRYSPAQAVQLVTETRPQGRRPSFSDNASSLASKIAQLNTQISCIRAGLHPITSVWCPMSYYRFIARDNASQAAELGGMALENDDMARGFGANVIRDLIREAPSQHAGWILEIARGNRVVAAIPFGD
jgi:hypothetical protein